MSGGQMHLVKAEIIAFASITTTMNNLIHFLLVELYSKSSTGFLLTEMSCANILLVKSEIAKLVHHEGIADWGSWYQMSNMLAPRTSALGGALHHNLHGIPPPWYETYQGGGIPWRLWYKAPPCEFTMLNRSCKISGSVHRYLHMISPSLAYLLCEYSPR